MRHRHTQTEVGGPAPGSPRAGAPRLRIGKHSVPLPHSRAARIATGSALMVGGTFSFLPILGLWMLPAGALVLSADSARIRRLRRKAELWWGRRNK
jgi:hypothetical protein